MTVLVGQFNHRVAGSDQFIETMIGELQRLERKGQTFYISIRGGGDNADVYGMALEYPQTDVGLSLLDSDSDGMAHITTAVNAARPTFYVTDSLPPTDGRWSEAQVIKEGYQADPYHSKR